MSRCERASTAVAYCASRSVGPVIAWVEHENDHGKWTDGLPHLCRHSPTGFEFGYAGSGPADLARSILGYHLGESAADPLYQAFKFAFLVTVRREEELRIEAAEIDRWLADRDRRLAQEAGA